MAEMLLQAYQAARIKTSVRMNGLLVPINLCPANLARFCRPVLFHNEHEFFDLSIGGSAFLTRYKSRNWMFCARHQLGQGPDARKPDEIVIAITEADGKGVALTSNEATEIRAQAEADSGVEDLLVLEFQSMRGDRNLAPLFFEVDLETVGDLESVSSERVIAIFAIGYQTSETDYEPVCDDDFGLIGTKIVSRWSKLYLKPASPGPWLLDGRIGLEIHDNQLSETARLADYSPDGFSGSPVMFIYKDSASQHHLGFGGIITDADKSGRFAVYKATHIKQVMRKLIEAASA